MYNTVSSEKNSASFCLDPTMCMTLALFGDHCVRALSIWPELSDILFLSTLDDALEDQVAHLKLKGLHLIVM